MKTLHLLRHAKSDWGDPGLCDHERPLNARGNTAARAMGRHLAAEGFAVDAVFCSTAKRARETLERLGPALGTTPVSFHDTLYMVSPRDVLAFIHRAPPSATSILVVGHNPTTHDVALSLSGRASAGARKALGELKEKYPTGALCTIRFSVSHWRQVAPGAGTLMRFLKPRDLTAERSPRR